MKAKLYSQIRQSEKMLDILQNAYDSINDLIENTEPLSDEDFIACGHKLYKLIKIEKMRLNKLKASIDDTL